MQHFKCILEVKLFTSTDRGARVLVMCNFDFLCSDQPASCWFLVWLTLRPRRWKEMFLRNVDGLLQNYTSLLLRRRYFSVTAVRIWTPTHTDLKRTYNTQHRYSHWCPVQCNLGMLEWCMNIIIAQLVPQHCLLPNICLKVKKCWYQNEISYRNGLIWLLILRSEKGLQKRKTPVSPVRDVLSRVDWQGQRESALTMAQISQQKCGTTQTRDTLTNYNRRTVTSTSR